LYIILKKIRQNLKVRENKKEKKTKGGENDRKAGAHKKRPIQSTQRGQRKAKRSVSATSEQQNKAAMATRCLAVAGSLPLLSASTAAAAAARAQPLPSAAAPRRALTRLSVATDGDQQLVTVQDPAHGQLLLFFFLSPAVTSKIQSNLIVREGMDTLSMHE